ncbi:DNA gyrase subunit A [Candidatus Sneabacter namystus]|uniref:DNA gyrase subunit A n=1 Tax=Candidatus Sneabacter namystus TaxID=2601646 RepID=A0A5C0UGX8_9RICK|nr:DNA gyrase subunit A [Candidatus Sneabacter namystus]QEK39385.1 DNA gyrase subunit A [Candidatus Sneabacter namystus]
MNLEAIESVDITQEVKGSYLDYAMSVIVSRALPDVRDGLKPVHRRILYSMYMSGFMHNRPHKKSARTVGDVIGKYHPHGETAIYDALVRMAQGFSLRIPLIDGQGNFGSIDGDDAASIRYTEARLAKISDFLLKDIALGTVNFRPNYDNSEKEPEVLPALVPNLLLNGSGGIAVGMATNIPPHNLGQLVDACCLYVDNPDVSVDELIDVLEGPDFPTQGVVIGINNLRKAYKTGRGVIMIKGKTEIENYGERQAIVITEIPYAVNKAKMVEKIGELIKEGRIVGVSDLRDESDRSGIRVVVELKRDTIAEVVVKQLYTYTPLQVSYGMNMLALDNNMPKLMNLREIIGSFIDFRKEVVHRRTTFLLIEARHKGEILLGLLLAVSNIDELVRTIKLSKDYTEAKERLMLMKWNTETVTEFLRHIFPDHEYGAQLQLSATQAKAILDMRIARLTGLESQKIIYDLRALVVEIAEYEGILSSAEKLLSILKEELVCLRKEFNSPRLTLIQKFEEKDLSEEDLIPEEEMVVTFTMSGYVKRLSLDTYRAQRRGGKGKLATNVQEDDAITNIIVGSTHAKLLFFSTTGQVYKLKLHELPLASLQAKGKPIANLLPLASGESIADVLSFSVKNLSKEDVCIVFVTQKGKIRKNMLSDFEYIPSNGKMAIRLEDDDRLISVQLCSLDDQIMLATAKGKCIRFCSDAVRVFKSRSSDGVRGIKLAKDDKVVSKAILSCGSYSQQERNAYLTIPFKQRSKLLSDQGDLSVMKVVEKMGITDMISLSKISDMARDDVFLLSVTEKGYGKCSSCFEYRTANRGGSGVANLAVSATTGDVVGVVLVKDLAEAELMLITDLGRVIRCKLDNVRVTGRNTRGVILVKTRKNERVVSVALIHNAIDVDQIE